MTAGPAGATTVGHLRYAIQGDATTWPDVTATAAREHVVVLHAWQTSRLRALKAADPSLQVLVYQDLAAMNSLGRQHGLTSSGVGYDEADTAHPGWFLLDTAGKRFSFSAYGFLWAADVGDAGYQARWADNVAAILAAAPWDGVFMDDTNPTLKYHANPSSVARYPTDAAYQAATRSMLAAVSARLRAAAPGKLLVANMGAWIEYQAVIKDWLQFVDGAMDEMWAKYGSTAGAGYRDTWSWEKQLDNAREAERQGKLFLAITQSQASDRAAARYGLASLLLAGSGDRASFELNSNYADETWFPEYDYDLGAPVAAAVKAGPTGVWTRAFARGLVVVNPTTSSRAVSLGAAYSGSGLSGATVATLPPQTALILTRDDAGADPVPVPVPEVELTATPTPTTPPSPPAAATPTPPTAATPPPTTVRAIVRCVRARASCRGRIVLRARAMRVHRTVRIAAGARKVVGLRVPHATAGRWRVATQMRSGRLRVLSVR